MALTFLGDKQQQKTQVITIQYEPQSILYLFTAEETLLNKKHYVYILKIDRK